MKFVEAETRRGSAKKSVIKATQCKIFQGSSPDASYMRPTYLHSSAMSAFPIQNVMDIITHWHHRTPFDFHDLCDVAHIKSLLYDPYDLCDLSDFLLKFRTPRVPRKSNHIPDIIHPRNKLDHPFKPQPESRMGNGTKAAGIEVPPQLFFGNIHALHPL
jgi:hypothetical protein